MFFRTLGAALALALLYSLVLAPVLDYLLRGAGAEVHAAVHITVAAALGWHAPDIARWGRGE